MKRLLQVGIVLSLVYVGSANADSNLKLNNKIGRGDKTAVLVVWDVVSLNHPKQSDLFLDNYKQFEKDFTSKSFRNLKIHQVEFFVMNATVHSEAIITDRKPKKVFQKTIEAMESIKNKIDLTNVTNTGKDIVSTIEYINIIVNEKYQSFDHIITVFYSNFRQSINIDKVKKLKNIELNPKISKMIVFAKSGLDYTSQISSSQIIQADKNIQTFFTSKLPSEKLSWYSNY